MRSGKHILALAFAASIATAGAATFASAAPMHGGGGGGHAPGGHVVAHGHGQGPAGHWHGHHHRGWGYGAYPAFYGGDYYYGNGCGWLHRKAAVTGSRYWWSRYYACIGE